MSAWGELANAHGASRAVLAAHVVDLARVAVAVEGLPTLLLPSEQVTAVHEAGHTVLHAAQGHRPSVMRIWPDRVGQGYAGACDFPLEVPALHLHPLHQPHQALMRAGGLGGGVAVRTRRVSAGQLARRTAGGG